MRHWEVVEDFFGLHILNGKYTGIVAEAVVWDCSQLAADVDGPVQKSPDSIDTYTINIRAMIDSMRQKHTEAVIRDRFTIIGRAGARLITGS